jgi:colanic acid biosynthesis glycosyl transferase WcaI
VVNGVIVHRVNTATRGRANLVGRALDYASFHVAAAVKLAQILEPGDIVVAKTDPPLISIVVSHVARVKRAILVNWLQDVFPEVAARLGVALRPQWLARSLKAARNASLRRAAANVVLGERMRQHLLTQGIDPTRLRVIPNWADAVSVLPKPAAESAIRTSLQLQGQFVVAYSGNLGRAHEFDTFLGAARLLSADPAFTFLMTGGGARMDALRRAVEEDGPGNFIFLPYQPRELLADSLTAADVHLVSLVPALEGLIVPSKFYGILAAGRPAIFIGDPQGELARVIRAEDVGVVLGVGDSQGLADVLKALRDSPVRLNLLGRNARSLALAEYTCDHATTAWLALLKDLVPALVPDFSSERIAAVAAASGPRIG